jgi:hypothetical protein
MLFDLHFCGEQAAQRIALVDGKRGNDTARVRDGFEPLALARRQSQPKSSVSRVDHNRTEDAKPKGLILSKALFHHGGSDKMAEICTVKTVPHEKRGEA